MREEATHICLCTGCLQRCRLSVGASVHGEVTARRLGCSAPRWYEAACGSLRVRGPRAEAFDLVVWAVVAIKGRRLSSRVRWVTCPGPACRLFPMWADPVTSLRAARARGLKRKQVCLALSGAVQRATSAVAAHFFVFCSHTAEEARCGTRVMHLLLLLLLLPASAVRWTLPLLSSRPVELCHWVKRRNKAR